MALFKTAAAAFLLATGAANAEDGAAAFRCEGESQQDAQQSAPASFSVEIVNKSVKLGGVEGMESKFALIQKDDNFYVFKNARKTQGGNIDRRTGRISLYVLDKAARRITLSVEGQCAKE